MTDGTTDVDLGCKGGLLVGKLDAALDCGWGL